MDLETDELPPRRDRVALACRIAIPVVAVVTPVATFLLGWAAVALVFQLAGGTPPSAADQRVAGRLALVACAVAVGLPVLGFVLAVRSESRFSIWAFAVMTVLGLVFSAVVIVGFAVPIAIQNEPSPAPSPTRSVCQESSGGDNRCPGG